MVIGAAIGQSRAYELVDSLTTKVGARFSGTPESERAIAWALDAAKQAGLSNVRREPVTVPRWIRGELDVRVTSPIAMPLIGLALGNSPSTPPDGVEAEIMIVKSLDDFKARAAEAKGKIVLFNGAMRRSAGFDGYGEAVSQRSRGASEAYKAGALAVLVRSIGTGNHGLPHAGSMWNGPFVPASAIRAEDADLIARLGKAGPVRVKVKQTSRTEGTVQSGNVVGELPGGEKPDEIVLIGAHLDSWDNAPGAIDDGAGCAIVLETVRLIKALGLQPRRTIRVVLFMNEENGLSGGKAYAETHKAELGKHVVAMEADSGAGRPVGVTVTVEAGKPQIAETAALLRGLGVSSEINLDEDGGADLIPITEHVPVLLVNQDVTDYFDWHHTTSDTIDKINPLDLNLALASFAALTFASADRLETLPKPLAKSTHKR